MAFGFPQPAQGGFMGQLAQMREQNPTAWNTIGASLLAGPTFRQGMQGAAQMMPQAMQADRQHLERARVQNATKQWLMAQPDLDDQTKAMLAANPDLAGKLFLQKIGGGTQPKTSLVPVWGRGPDGKWRMVQPSETGKAVETEFPEGFEPAPLVQNLDVGTGYQPTFRQGGGVAGPAIPKDVAGEKAAAELGANQGKAAASLPSTLQSSQRILESIDSLLSDPGLSRITGPLQSWLPNVSGTANRAQSKLDQVIGGSFLQAYNDLRGAGAITEQEGQAAKAAYQRLQATGMNDKDFRDALMEFRTEVERLMDIAKQRAGQGGGQQPAQGGALAPGTYNWSPDGGLNK